MDSYVVKVQHEGTIRRLTLALGEKEFSYEQLQNRIRNLFQLPASAEFVLTYTDKDGDVVTMAEDEDLKDALVLQKLNPLRVTIGNLLVGTDDVKASSPLDQKELKSDEATEQQQSIQGEQIPQPLSKALEVDQFANVGPEEKVATTSNGAADSNPSDASSPASAEAVDAPNRNSPEGATPAGRFSVRLDVKRNNGGRQIHHGIGCDGCNMLPIQGPRFKSCKRPNYDLCLKCFEASGAEENEYAKIDRLFHRIGYPAYVGRMRELQRARERMCTTPDQGQNSTPTADEKDEAGNKTAAAEGNSTAGVLHEGVQCDECGMVPIQGSRYKSTTRFNYDVCHGCFEKSGSNASEYTCIEKPHYHNARGHPVVMRRGPSFEQCPGRWVWVLNQMVSGQAVDIEAGAGEKTPPAAGSDVRVGRDVVAPPQAEAAAATERTSTSTPTAEIDSAPLFAKPAYESADVQAPVDVEKSASSSPTESDVNDGGETDSAPLFAKPADESAEVQTPVEDVEKSASSPSKENDVTDVGETDSAPLFAKPADESAEVQTSVEHVKKSASSSTESDVKNDAGKTAGEEKIAQALAAAVAADETGGGVEEETVQAQAVAAADGGGRSIKEGLLGKLAAMGFEDPKLNEELLGKNNFDLRRTLDDLCAAEEWDPILGELQEMGFYDANMNRRLMFKNNGSVKRVVKELVQMYK